MCQGRLQVTQCKAVCFRSCLHPEHLQGALWEVAIVASIRRINCKSLEWCELSEAKSRFNWLWFRLIKPFWNKCQLRRALALSRRWFLRWELVAVVLHREDAEELNSKILGVHAEVQNCRKASDVLLVPNRKKDQEELKCPKHKPGRPQSQRRSQPRRFYEPGSSALLGEYWSKTSRAHACKGQSTKVSVQPEQRKGLGWRPAGKQRYPLRKWARQGAKQPFLSPKPLYLYIYIYIYDIW